MAIIACSAVAITMCWAVRWRPQANDNLSITSIEEGQYVEEGQYDDSETACGSNCPEGRGCHADPIDIFDDEDATTLAVTSPVSRSNSSRQY
jgi:hypothetical protein